MDDPIFTSNNIVGGSSAKSNFSAISKTIHSNQSFILIQTFTEADGGLPFDISSATSTLFVSAYKNGTLDPVALTSGVLSDSGGGTIDTVTFTVPKDLIPVNLGTFPQRNGGNSRFFYILEDADSVLEFAQGVNVIDPSYDLTGEVDPGASTITTQRNDLGTVEDTVIVVPPAQSFGLAYVVGPAGATGDWTGLENNLVVSNGSSWIATLPEEGNFVFDKNAGAQKTFGTSWELSADGDMLESIYDPQTIQADAFDRANMTGTQDHDTISDYDTELAGTANVTSFTPTADFHPATKIYVDNPKDDTLSIAQDPVDNTKQMRIDAGAVATATTRVLTMPDNDVDLADIAAANSHIANDANPHAVTPLQVGNTTAQWNADKIQDIDVVDLSGISNGEVLAFNGSSGDFEPVANGGAGTSGRPAFECNFNTDVTASEPATGGIKFDNSVPGSATTIRCSITDINTINITTQLSRIGSGDTFIVYQVDTPTKFLYFSVTSSTLVTTSYDIIGTSISGGVAIDNGAACGVASYVNTVGGASGVASFNGRTGGVVPAAGDYDNSQNTNTSGVSGATTADALNTLNNTVSPEAVAGGTDNNQAGVAYTLVLTDKDNTNVYMNNALVNTLTIPLNATVAFPIGTTKIPVMQEGVGITTIDGAVGVTINGVLNGSVVINNRFQGGLLQKRGTDTWIVSGDIT